LTADFINSSVSSVGGTPSFDLAFRVPQDFLFDRGSASLSVVPLPAGLPLLLSGLAGLALLRRRG